MADRTLEATKGVGREAAVNGEAAAAAAGGGGIKAFLPMIITVLSMPVLAFVTTQYVLLPRVQKAVLQQMGGGSAETVSTEKTAEGGSGEGKPGKATVALSKMLVNVAGTMGTRYLMASMTLVGSGADFHSKIEDNRDQLMDLGQSALSTKTIADLEKPGARNLIRSEMINVFNGALGGPVIKDIYYTEWAIQ